MPELPEVETVRRGLQPVLEGARLSRVEQRRPDLRFAFPEGFVQRLTGATITALERRAKYLLARLDRGDTLVMHLGMTGRFTPVIPRDLRLEVPERMDAQGRIRQRKMGETHHDELMAWVDGVEAPDTKKL